MTDIILLSGSPSISSRTDLALHYAGDKLIKEGFDVKHISIQDIPAEVLFHAQFDHPKIKEVTNLLRNAKAVIVGSPVYKAAYSGVLKALLDLLPPDVLQDTPVLPVMTGGSGGHLLSIEYSLKPLLASLKGQCLQGVYIVDKCIDKQQTEEPIVDEETKQRLINQLTILTNTTANQRELLFT
ncbi:NADPH-dependent FMN reductase [Gracilibacillus kekensis]|uniref:FMN reductase n=1 Tax=Gracilibacillus kekensis TaxID=1027249 RepID=A0A1M7JLQ7_9BACI|nr:NADPH-dependent FMN reductase [Gracilibacillus kekensis]SHM53841.1 FMN reductase [Gracilibacillus kekensis]